MSGHLHDDVIYRLVLRNALCIEWCIVESGRTGAAFYLDVDGQGDGLFRRSLVRRFNQQLKTESMLVLAPAACKHEPWNDIDTKLSKT